MQARGLVSDADASFSFLSALGHSLDEREFADLDVDRVVVLVQRAVCQCRKKENRNPSRKTHSLRRLSEREKNALWTIAKARPVWRILKDVV